VRGQFKNVLRFVPPFTTDGRELDRATEILERALGKTLGMKNRLSCPADAVRSFARDGTPRCGAALHAAAAKPYMVWLPSQMYWKEL
jgi:hypothetical protein